MSSFWNPVSISKHANFSHRLLTTISTSHFKTRTARREKSKDDGINQVRITIDAQWLDWPLDAFTPACFVLFCFLFLLHPLTYWTVYSTTKVKTKKRTMMMISTFTHDQVWLQLSEGRSDSIFSHFYQITKRKLSICTRRDGGSFHKDRIWWDRTEQNRTWTDCVGWFCFAYWVWIEEMRGGIEDELMRWVERLTGWTIWWASSMVVDLTMTRQDIMIIMITTNDVFCLLPSSFRVLSALMFLLLTILFQVSIAWVAWFRVRFEW